jgi:competence protein ComEA
LQIASKAERLADRGAPIDLNLATIEELTLLPGVGEATAERILALRARKGGRFAAIDELLEVRGIGEQRLAAIRAHVVVDGGDAEGLQ